MYQHGVASSPKTCELAPPEQQPIKDELKYYDHLQVIRICHWSHIDSMLLIGQPQ
jgi:hypothetical protein